MVATREGEEVWQNTSRGLVYVRVSAPKPNRPGNVRSMRVEGRARMRISTADRELYSESVPKPKRDVFRNGVMKRLDEPAPERPADPEYREEQALTDEELRALFAKNGRAFQAAINKLDERNCLRMKALVQDSDSQASQAQATYVLLHVKEAYASIHVPSHSREIQEELDEGGMEL